MSPERNILMSCVIFGAGKIARGFIGHLLYLSDIPFAFVEKADVLVDLLNERGQYPVNILGAPEKNCTVKGIPALKFSDEEEIVDRIAHADAVFNAVGGKNLDQIVPFYTKGIERRAALAEAVSEKLRGGAAKEALTQEERRLLRPLNFITCENWKKPADILRSGIDDAISEEAKPWYQENVGITEAVILRSGIDATAQQREADPLWVNVQDYWQLHVDASRLKGVTEEDIAVCNGRLAEEPSLSIGAIADPQGPDLLRIKGLHLLDSFDGFLERKFYTYNAANGTVSFMGALLGYEILSDAARDPFILENLDGVYRETSQALCKKYGFEWDDQWAFTRTSLKKLQDVTIVDTIERNARDPIRKLGPDDRLVGSARMVYGYGILPEHLCTSIACAIFYKPPVPDVTDDSADELARLRREEGIDYIIEHVCRLDPAGEIADTIRAKISMLKERGYIKE